MKIRLFAGEIGMLPQLNSTPRIEDLKELAIQVVGEADGRFNKTDYIIFYGKGPDKVFYDQNNQTFNYDYNLYSRQNFYFITVSETNGLRIAASDDLGGTNPLIHQFDDYTFHKISQRNILKSGRQWFGEEFDFTLEQKFVSEIPGIPEGSTIKVISRTMAQSFNPSSFKIFFKWC
ncbi:MAG: hypothetical protein HC811_08655 [Flammeovirgaceae bacterium]|nr:hypothetical protein [Flammeovirgaceae bacterium]